jgi:hypothetical protein
VKGDGAAEGPEVRVFLELPGDGGPRHVPIDRVLIDPRTNKPFPKSVKFRFTGSVLTQADPARPEKTYGADLSGTLIVIYPVTNETVLQSSLTMKEEKYLKLEVNPDALPREGTAVKLVLEVVP